MQMRLPYYTICFLLGLCLFPVMFLSCYKNDGQDCAHMPDCSARGVKELGRANLYDSNDYMLAFAPQYGSVNFSNGQGVSFDYRISKDPGADAEKIRSYPGPEVRCCGTITYFDYLRKENETVRYDPYKDGPYIAVQRYLKAGWTLDQQDSLHITSREEFLSLDFAGQWFSINTDKSFQNAEQQFHDTIVLRNKAYYEVFEMINSKVDTTQILHKGCYFSFEKGIIGFYMTNGELWLQE